MKKFNWSALVLLLVVVVVLVPINAQATSKTDFNVELVSRVDRLWDPADLGRVAQVPVVPISVTSWSPYDNVVYIYWGNDTFIVTKVFGDVWSVQGPAQLNWVTSIKDLKISGQTEAVILGKTQHMFCSLLIRISNHIWTTWECYPID